jgi:hypothetical protein
MPEVSEFFIKLVGLLPLMLSRVQHHLGLRVRQLMWHVSELRTSVM